jgi:hypothetical protein
MIFYLNEHLALTKVCIYRCRGRPVLVSLCAMSEISGELLYP